MLRRTHHLALLGAALLLALGGAGCAGTQALTIVHTTDVHGAFSPNAQGAGGLRAVAAMVDGLRGAGRAVLVVDSGDMWSGTLLSDGHEGAPGVEAYNAIGYSAAALGNHEFDYGPVGPSRVGGDAFGALEARMAQARFPILAANVRARPGVEAAAHLVFQPHTIVERGGLEVGIIGVITPSTPSMAFPYVGEALEFEPAAPVVEREARALRAAGVDVVVVLSHIGSACTFTPVSAEEHAALEASVGVGLVLSDKIACEGDSELAQLVGAVPEGLVDVWLGGHTHKRVMERRGGAVVAHGLANAREIAQIELYRDEGVLTVTGDLVPVTATAEALAASKAARAVDEILLPLEREQADVRGEKLGASLAAPLGRDYDQGSAMGSFVCDALMARLPGTDACLYNSGGLRADLPAGEITYGGVYDVLPFGNAVSTLDVTGAELHEIIRIGTSGAHGSVQVGGLEIEFDRGRDHCPTVDRNGDGHIDEEDRDRIVSLTLADGSPLDPAKIYHLATNSFLAAGGDSLASVMKRLPPERVRTELDRPDREEVVAYLKANPRVFNTTEAPAATDRVRAIGEEPTGTCPAP